MFHLQVNEWHQGEMEAATVQWAPLNLPQSQSISHWSVLAIDPICQPIKQKPHSWNYSSSPSYSKNSSCQGLVRNTLMLEHPCADGESNAGHWTLSLDLIWGWGIFSLFIYYLFVIGPVLNNWVQKVHLLRRHKKWYHLVKTAHFTKTTWLEISLGPL